MNWRSVTSHLCGGLGNQMFQYAVGRAVSLRLQVPLCLNISAFATAAGGPAHARWRLPLFPRAVGPGVSVSATPPSWLHACLRRISRFVRAPLRRHIPLFPHIVTEPRFGYWHGIESLAAPCHLYGYWQSENYFSRYADQIRKDLAFPDVPAGGPQALAARIKACPAAVSVHIRRGDYVSDPSAAARHGLPGAKYYRAALARIRAQAGEATIFVFSDEPQWAREHFDPCGHALEVVDLDLPAAPQHDMHLMALCRHHVIANSSFSWWGAWLGEQGGVTIAPARWFADPGVNTEHICPPTWLRLES